MILIESILLYKQVFPYLIIILLLCIQILILLNKVQWFFLMFSLPFVKICGFILNVHLDILLILYVTLHWWDTLLLSDLLLILLFSFFLLLLLIFTFLGILLLKCGSMIFSRVIQTFLLIFALLLIIDLINVMSCRRPF